MKKLGLVAGNGNLPAAIAVEARAKGYTVFAVGLDPLVDKALSSVVDEIKYVNVGKLGKIIETLKKAGVGEVIMAGKVPKSLLYKSRITPDLRAAKLLLSLKDRSDDSLMLAITREMEKDGITLLGTADLSPDLLTPEGVLTKKGPSRTEWEDIEFGWRMAKEIGRLDIGQTVVVKDHAVMAIEAIEGTDETIKRGGAFAGEGAVVVKVSKPSQDSRFDVPVVGMETLAAMRKVNARVLAVEAKKSILLNRGEMISEADRARISIVGHI
jgi:DUF1009 family protein